MMMMCAQVAEMAVVGGVGRVAVVERAVVDVGVEHEEMAGAVEVAVVVGWVVVVVVVVVVVLVVVVVVAVVVEVVVVVGVVQVCWQVRASTPRQLRVGTESPAWRHWKSICSWRSHRKHTVTDGERNLHWLPSPL